MAAPAAAPVSAPVLAPVAARVVAPLPAPVPAPVPAPATAVLPPPLLAANPVQPIAALPQVPAARAQSGMIADEMRSMRGFIEDQLATLAWRDGVSRDSTRLRVLSDLISSGLSPALSRSLIDHLPQNMSYEQSREWVSQIMQKNLLHSGPADDLTDQGGVFALVGPTGVGKTTTAAKMAARFAVKYGVNQLALITTDAYRIGAQDQLQASTARFLAFRYRPFTTRPRWRRHSVPWRNKEAGADRYRWSEPARRSSGRTDRHAARRACPAAGDPQRHGTKRNTRGSRQALHRR